MPCRLVIGGENGGDGRIDDFQYHVRYRRTVKRARVPRFHW
jgi:hypothetical protein